MSNFEPRRDDSRRDDPRRDDPRRDDPRRDDPRRDDSRRDDSRRDDPRRDEPRRDEPRRDESRRDVTRWDSIDSRRASNMHSPEPRSSSVNPSPSGSRSGNFSSRTFTVPIKQSDHAQIPSRVPDISNLVNAFSQYTESLVATSALRFQFDLMKGKAEKQQNLKERWSKHYHNFISLAEDHDRVAEHAETVAESFEKQVKHMDEAQEVAVRTLMSTLMANSAAANPKAEEYSSLREEVWNMKEGLRATNADLETVKYEKKRGKGLTVQQDMEQKLRTMSDYEQKMAELTVSHSKLQATVNQHDQVLLQLPDVRNRVHHLNGFHTEYQSDLSKLKDNVKDALDAITAMQEQKSARQTMSEDLTSQKSSIQELVKDLAVQKSDWQQSIADQKQKVDALVGDFAVQKDSLAQMIALQDEKFGRVLSDLTAHTEQIDNLNIELVGNLDKDSDKQSKGLIDYIAEGREKSDKFESALVIFDKELDGFGHKLGALENGIRIPGSLAPVQDLPSPQVDGASHNLNPDSLDRISSLEEVVKANHADSLGRITQLEIQSKSLEEQQEMKDDFVSAEVERLDNYLIKQDQALKAIHADLSAWQSQVASASAQKPLTPPPPPPIEIHREPDESFQLKVEELESTMKRFKESSTERVEAIEILVESQQQRFDNLSTEHLAKSIIHQMQALYPPHPAGLQAKFDQIKAKQAAFDQHVLNFITTIGRLNDGMNNHNNRIDHLQGTLFVGLERSSLDKIRDFMGVQKEMERRVLEMERRVLELDNLARNKRALDNLERRFSESPKPTSDAQAGLERKLGDLKKISSDRFENLDRKYNEMKQSSSKRFGEVERTQTEMSKKVTDDRDSLRKDLDEHINSFQDVQTEIATWREDNASKIAAVENVIKGTQSRLDDVEATTTEEIASLHGSLHSLKNLVPLPQAELRVVQDLQDVDSDAPLAQQQQHTPTNLPRNTSQTAERQDKEDRQDRRETQERQEPQERQSRQKGKRKKGSSSPVDTLSSDSDPPVPSRPLRKSNRGMHLTEKKLNRF
ncbi:hypothetical protein MMC07_000914 [Pseudocyphellaria aurata]|nr:hypothetical protein [Pseudocyphellaria aurata]